MKKAIFDLFRIPYYYALIAKHQDVIERATVRQKKNIKYFRLKSRKLTFMLPDDKKTNVPPLKIKSGRLIVYDINSAIPMRLVSNADEGIDWMDEETRTAYVCNPKQFYLTPLDVSELNTFLDSHITQDILSDNEREIPWWLVVIIVSAIAVIGLVIVAWIVTKGITPPQVVNIIPTPSATPTPFIPGVMS